MKKTLSAVLILTGFWVVAEIFGGTKSFQVVSSGTGRRRGRIILAVILGVLGCAVGVFLIVWWAFSIFKPDCRHLFDAASAPYWLTLAGTYAGAVGSTERALPPGKPKWKDVTSLVGWIFLLFASGFGIVSAPAAA